MSAPDSRLADARARQLAQREFSRPLALEAGAGTGKTAVLVARVVAWCLGAGWQRAQQRLRAASGSAEELDDGVAAEALRRVAAITFTEAAAAEMETRVGLALRRIARGELPEGIDAEALPADPELRQRRAQALAAHRDQLSVRTIHAFCRRILAAHPLEAGLHPRFEIDAQQRLQGQVAREILEARLREAFGEPGSPDFLELADQGLGPADLERALRELLLQGAPATLLDADPLAPPRIRRFADALRGGVEGFLADGGARLAEVRGAERIAAAARAALATRSLLASGVPEEPAALEAWLGALRALWDAKDVKKLGEFAAGDFGAKGAAALGSPEAAEAVARRAADWLPLLRHALALLPGRLGLLRRVLQPLLREAEERLRRRGVLGFAGILRETRRLLAQREDVAAGVRGEIDQLLVDEFQDTDATQCEILAALALAGPRSERPGLFLVGDPKQSIFGWRSADLAAYEGFLARLRAEGGSVERLAVNFRSVPAILAEVERVVAPAMREQAGLQPRFERLLACEELAGAAGFAGADRAPVEHWISWGFDAGAGRATPLSARRAAELEARAVARDLREIHDRDGVAFDRMALLFRSTGDFEIYLSALRERAVPFVVERDTTFYERREIVDALALVCCVLDPHDHLSLVTALRSSAVGVPDAALVPLWRRGFPDLAGRVGPEGGEAALARLREAIAGACAALPADVPGLARVEGWDANLAAFGDGLAELRRAFESEPAALFVEQLRTSLLLEASEAARHLGAWRLANLDRFFRALAEALEETGGDRAAVLSHLRRAVTEEREHEEGRPRAAADDAVHVTTIHKAKGLDFDHVYVLQLHKGGGKDDPRETRVGAGEGGDAPAPEYRLCGVASLGFHETARRRVEIERHERVRLLYVALTRARQRLVLAGSYPRAPSAMPRTLADLWALRAPGPPPLAPLMAELASAGRCAAADEVRWSFPALAAEAPAAAAAPATRGAWDAASVARAEADLAALRAAARERAGRDFHAVASRDRDDAESILAHLYGAEDEGGHSRPRDPERARRVALAVGTAVHAGLERLDPEAEREAQRQRFAEEVEAALALGAPPEDRPAARAGALELFERFRAGPLFERLRRIGTALVARELPVLLAPSDAEGPVGFWSGSIDLLYRDPETGELVVADYKTDRAAAGEIRELAEHYRRQGGVYTRAVQAALGLDHPPRFELWFLSLGEVVALGADKPAAE